jgi:hypothetical protein
MPQEIQVGTILMSELPPLFGVESKPYSGSWSVVQALEAFALERKIRAAGWTFFFIASEAKATFFGAPGANKIGHALTRILGKVSGQHFNGLQVTGIVAKHFLGLPYTVVSAHSRHVQHNCYLDNAEVRRSSQHDAAWARG